jgi:hypothetical protein
VDLRGWLYREPVALPLGLTDKTPAGRRRLALVFCGLAGVVALTILCLQEQTLWPGGVLVAACLVVALQFLRESKLPVYLQKGTPIVDVWEIVPGESIGPLRLGPLNFTAIRLLRSSVVIVQQGPVVTCLLRHVDGWTAVVARTGELTPDCCTPDPMAFESINRIVTTSPAHLAPDGVRVGSALPNVAAVLGVPHKVCKSSAAASHVLQWRAGLEAGLQENRIAWFGVSEYDGAAEIGSCTGR